MALQGDGNGIVTIPQASASGDFSVILSSVTLSAGTEIIIGDSASSGQFIAVFSGSDAGARIQGFDVTPNYSGTLNEVIKLEVSRVGNTVSMLVDDSPIGSVVVDSNTVFMLDTFFAYNSGSLKGEMLLSGTCLMSGFTGAGDRSYNFEGSGNTLVDTISGENGTLSGFTTGGFVGGGSVFDVAFPPDNYFKRGDVSKQITIPFSGTCTTTGTMEYSYDNSNWFTLDAAPTSTWSGNVVITGQQDIYLRLSDATGTVTTLNKLTATDLNIAVAMSQSNGVTRISNHQPISITGGNPYPMLYKDGAYSELADPTSFAENYGSYWVYLAQWYSEQGIQIGFTNVAVGGTSISAWQQGDTLLNRCETFATDAGGLDLVYTVIGETDSEGSMPQATFESLYSTAAQYLNTTYGATIKAIKFPVGSYLGGITDPSVVAIRAAYDNLIATYSFIEFAGDLSVIDIDKPGGDNLHLKTDQDAIDAFDIIVTAINSSTLNLVATGYPDGTYSAEIYEALNPLSYVETVNVTFSGGTAATPVNLSVGKTAYTRIDGSTPPSTGVTCYGVTE